MTPDAAGWRDISSAPRDGRWVVAMNDRHVFKTRWHPTFGWKADVSNVAVEHVHGKPEMWHPQASEGLETSWWLLHDRMSAVLARAHKMGRLQDVRAAPALPAPPEGVESSSREGE